MKKSSIIKLVGIVILSLIVLILSLTLNNKSVYVNFEYKIETITKVDNNLYITFYDDETNEQEESGKNIEYTIYGHQVDLSLLEHIKEGDIVNIIVEDNYGKFKYTIIYELKHNNEVIFDIMEEYSELGFNNKIVFLSFFSSMILFIVFLYLYKEKKKVNTLNDFEILRPTWEKYFFIGSIFGGLGFIVPFTLLYLLELCDVEYFRFSFVFYLFVILGLFGIYVCKKQKFKFTNETFIYHKVFGKAKSVRINEVKYILIILPKRRRGIAKIEFYNKANKKILKFGLDFNLFADGLLENVCKKYGIEIKLLSVKSKKLKIKKNKK